MCIEIVRAFLDFAGDIIALIIFLMIFYLSYENYRNIKQIKEKLNIK